MAKRRRRKHPDDCEVTWCHEPGAYTYYGKNVCERCWQRHCGTGPFDLRRHFKLKIGHTPVDRPIRQPTDSPKVHRIDQGEQLL